MVSICVVIPNYNGKDHLQICLPSLMKQTFRRFQITIVDNGSCDESVQYVKKDYPEVKVIPLERNLGFSKAVNIGIKDALTNPSISHVVLLNNDIECDPDFLNQMINGFRRENVGSVCPKMMDFYKRDVIDDAGDVVLRKKFPVMRGSGEKDTGQYSTPEFVFGACAGAAIYRKEVFEIVGFFDEDYFAFFEDVDFSFRLQYSGYKCFYNPKSVCYHKRGGTFSSFRKLHAYLLEKNIIALRVKNFPLQVLVKYSMFYQLHRVFRLFQYLVSDSPSVFFSGLEGYFFGILSIPKMLAKRKEILKKKKVEISYIKALMK